MANVVKIQSNLIRWAVERSGLSLADFPPAVEDWIAEKKLPTFKKLQEFARKAMVPFGYLFLDSPPIETIAMPDYRTVGDMGVRRPSPNLLDTIHDMKRRQAWMREYLLEEGNGELAFVGSKTLTSPVAETVASIHEWLKLDVDWARELGTWEDSLRFLVHRLDTAGILVFLNGVVGNSTNRVLDPEEFRGFVLSDPVAPVIFVNGSDSKAAQMFTLAHELAHLWLGENALVDLPELHPGNQQIERFCNRVAAEFLVPEERLRAVWSEFADDDEPFRALASQFKASPIVIARRAEDLRLIRRDGFFRFYHAYMQGMKQRKASRKGGGNFYRTQNSRIGRRFGLAVIQAAESGRLSYQDAYDLTHLHGATFDKYAAFLRSQEDK